MSHKVKSSHKVVGTLLKIHLVLLKMQLLSIVVVSFQLAAEVLQQTKGLNNAALTGIVTTCQYRKWTKRYHCPLIVENTKILYDELCMHSCAINSIIKVPFKLSKVTFFYLDFQYHNCAFDESISRVFGRLRLITLSFVTKKTAGVYLAKSQKQRIYGSAYKHHQKDFKRRNR